MSFALLHTHTSNLLQENNTHACSGCQAGLAWWEWQWFVHWVTCSSAGQFGSEKSSRVACSITVQVAMFLYSIPTSSIHKLLPLCSWHASKIDPELNNACWLITGTLQSTPLPALSCHTTINQMGHCLQERQAPTNNRSQDTLSTTIRRSGDTWKSRSFVTILALQWQHLRGMNQSMDNNSRTTTLPCSNHQQEKSS